MNPVEQQQQARDELIDLCGRLDTVFDRMTFDASFLGLQPMKQAGDIRASVRNLKIIIQNLSMTEAACNRRFRQSGHSIGEDGGHNAAS